MSQSLFFFGGVKMLEVSFLKEHLFLVKILMKPKETQGHPLFIRPNDLNCWISFFHGACIILGSFIGWEKKTRCVHFVDIDLEGKVKRQMNFVKAFVRNLCLEMNSCLFNKSKENG